MLSTLRGERDLGRALDVVEGAEVVGDVAILALAKLPGSRAVCRALLGSRAFLRSRYGFGGVFNDLGLIDGDFRDFMIRPLVDDPKRLEGQLRYALGIDWEMLDALAEGHGHIDAPVLMLWGEDDPWFPAERARAMVGQLKSSAGFELLPGKLFVHEEQPEAIAARILAFLAEVPDVRPAVRA